MTRYGVLQAMKSQFGWLPTALAAARDSVPSLPAFNDRLARLRVLLQNVKLPALPMPGGRSIAVVPALKVSAAVAGLWVAAETASLVGDLSAAPKPDLAAAPVTPESAGRQVRQVDTTIWQPVGRPVPILTIVSPEIEGLPVAHEARRNASGIREDLMSFGTFEDGRPLLQLVTRLGEREEHGRSFVIETVRRAGQLGLSADRIAQPSPVPTKIGPLEAADIVLGQSGQERACLAFRSFGQDMPLTISGWWCGTAQRPADRQQLICLFDRLMLAQRGETEELRAQFTAAELKRDQRCNPPRLAATGRKPHWLDADSRAVPLRNSTEQPEPPPRPTRTRSTPAR